MILRLDRLRRYPAVFRAMTGLSVEQFDDLADDLAPRLVEAERARLERPGRRRAVGAGHPFELGPRDRLLLAVVWLRRYPTHEVLAYLFGVSKPTAGRALARALPVLEAAGRDTMRMPDPGRGRRPGLDELLAQTPDLAVVVDSFEQRVQRPGDPTAQRAWYSGKKRQHTVKVQVAVDELTGRFVDVSDGVPGPTADITLLKTSGLMGRLPAGVGAVGDLAYLGIAGLHPQGLGATPRRKPWGKDVPRPPEDVEYNRAFARRRVVVEHRIGRLRTFQAVSQSDRHHRQGHGARARAVAGLVNRQLDQREAS